jgi:archaellum component FlaC
MNFYQMDVYEIERYLRNNSVESSELCKALIEKLSELTAEYEQLSDVLAYFDLSSDCSILEIELKQKADEIESLQDNVENLKHEISYLQNDLNVLKQDF